MARWSDAMRLSRYYEYSADLQYYGVYEIGFIIGGEFVPKYIGMADRQFLIKRIETYCLSAKCHNEGVRRAIARQRRTLYFHVMKITRPRGAALREALMLHRHGRGNEWLYEWNRRYEYQILRDSGYVVS